MTYLAIKHTHAALAVLSIVLFALRAVLSICHGKVLSRPIKVAMHLIDTVLFGLGCLLLYILSINPFVTPWIGIKLLAVVLYIVCGVLLMRSKHKSVKVFSLILCCALAAYIFTVAITKNPLSFFYLSL